MSKHDAKAKTARRRNSYNVPLQTSFESTIVQDALRIERKRGIKTQEVLRVALADYVEEWRHKKPEWFTEEIEPI